MAGFLFDKIVFGPVQSRRLGTSLGINLLPTGCKICSFNCIYCECGWTKGYDIDNTLFPPAALVKDLLEKKLIEYNHTKDFPDAISFAGNGEPTLHPEFSEIIDFTIELRNKYSPFSKIAVLSNASMLQISSVVNALLKVDKNILKLDAGTENTFLLINKPFENISFSEIVSNLKQFKSGLIIQTLFLRGENHGKRIDNTTEFEVQAWLHILSELKPESVMIYPIARETPLSGLEKISLSELNTIAEKAREIGLNVEVYY